VFLGPKKIADLSSFRQVEKFFFGGMGIPNFKTNPYEA
jgi:hypothetical protein